MASGTIKNNNHSTFSSRQDISSYTTSSNMFTCPNDGYIYIMADGAVLNRVIMKNSNGDNVAITKVYAVNNTAGQTIYVKAGMKFYFDFSETTYSKAYYFPTI